MKFQKLEPDATVPTYGTSGSAGLDLYALAAAEIPASTVVRIRTGISVAIPPNHVGLIADRSSLGMRGIKVFGGVIDSDYRGEIVVCLGALRSCRVAKGDRIAQLLIVPCRRQKIEVVNYLDPTGRGTVGFGSTGA